MAQLTVLMAGLLFIVKSEAGDLADRTTLQGFLSKYMPFGSDPSVSDYDKFILPNVNPVKHESVTASREEATISTKDFNPPIVADRTEKQAVQKVLSNDSSNPIALSVIGMGLLSLVTMLVVRLRKGLQPATIPASNGGLALDTPMNAASAFGEHVMEMKTQDPDINHSTAAFDTRPACKVSSSRVGWGQLTSQNSHPLTLCYATPPGEQTGSSSTSSAAVVPPHAAAPARSPQGLENRYWAWRGQTIRYQINEPTNPTGQRVLLVHGLFVNADHWRKTLKALGEAGVTAYAIDLLGSGWSSKPYPTSEEAQKLSGEKSREAELAEPDTFAGIELGTADGRIRPVAYVDKRHPVQGSCYNFYTWAEQLCDFTEEVIGGKTALVCNSIGTISGLQAALDRPDAFEGLLSVSPNFRELHSAEASPLAMPLVRFVQKQLRENGHALFDSLANPGTVKQILAEPYAVKSAVTDELVDVLLSPLLTDGAADVVFDTLSYSAGPLPEEQLSCLSDVPVWVCYGDADPWTPPKRVDALERYAAVERVQSFPGVGHCPHDEAPERVNPFILEFLERLRTQQPQKNSVAALTTPQQSLSATEPAAVFAVKPTRRTFFSNAAGAACGLALPAVADSGGVPMDLGPLGLKNGGSGKLNSCPPQGIKRGCISTSKFDTDNYVPPWTYQGATGSKTVEDAFGELMDAVAAQPGAAIMDTGAKANGRYLRAEFTIPKTLPFGSDEIDDVEFLIAAPGQSDPPNLVDYHSVTRSGGSADNKRHRERIKSIRKILEEKGWKSVGRLLL